MCKVVTILLHFTDISNKYIYIFLNFMLRLLPYSIDINWSVMFTEGHPTVTFLYYGCDVWASKYIMCVRFQSLWLSDQE